MSQDEMVLRALRRGEKLTPIDALKRFGCFRLGARVHTLRQDGHKILTTIVEVGDGKHVARYSMRRKAA
jgi:hypothetical protein